MDTGRPIGENGNAILAALRSAAFRRATAERAECLDRIPAVPPQNDIEALARLGLLWAPVPRSLGGCGWGTEAAGAPGACESLRLVGRNSLALGRLYEGHVNAVRLVLRYGSGAARAQLLQDVRDGRLFGVWNSEPASGGLEVDGGVLVGRKILCSGIGIVERALVTCASAGGGPVGMLVVPLARGSERGEVLSWTASGMRASVTGSMDFTGVALAGCTEVGQPGDYLAEPHFSGGAWRFLAVQLGAIEAIGEALRAHLARTGRGGDPHQASRFGAVLTAAETARLWVQRAGHLAEGEEEEPERIVAYVNLARGVVERAALDLMELAQRSVGLQAFMQGQPIERMMRDLGTYLRQPAPDRALVAGATAGLRCERHVGDQWC
jgi:alkylation response protein AidB-like acyl-CoA dehydrogenase